MTAINTNHLATLASNSLTRNERSMATSMERLSTGLRINSAKDDAAGLAIASKMTSQIRGLNQAVRNANDAISMLQTVEGALVEIGNMQQRMRELAVQAASDTNVSEDRTALDAEFQELEAEITRIGTNTEWNGTVVFTPTTFTYQVGANADQTITFSSTAITDAEVGISTTVLTDQSDANTAIGLLDTAIAAISTRRAGMGAVMSRLQFAADNLANVAAKTLESRGRILDADYAKETTELARTQIIAQAGTAMLAQANQAKQSVLALLK